MKLNLFLTAFLFLFTAQATPIQLASSVKDYFKLIKEEARKDGVILEYSILSKNNGVELTILNEANHKDAFHVHYLMESAKDFRTKIYRDGTSAFVQDRSDSYITLNNFVVENNPDAEELLKILDKTFRKSLDSLELSASEQQAELLKVPRFRKFLYDNIAKDKKTYYRAMFVFTVFVGMGIYDTTFDIIGLHNRPLIGIVFYAYLAIKANNIINEAKAFYSINYKFSDIRGLTLLAERWRQSVYDKNQLSCKNVF